MGITVTGMPQLIAKITAYGDFFEDMTPSLQAAIDAGVNNATEIVPVDTGHLQSTIYGQVNSPTEAEMGATAEYAFFVENGTIHMDASPFIAPSLEIALKALTDDIAQRIGSLR